MGDTLCSYAVAFGSLFAGAGVSLGFMMLILSGSDQIEPGDTLPKITPIEIDGTEYLLIQREYGEEARAYQEIHLPKTNEK